MRRCPECNSENSDDTLSCTHCGAPLDAVEPEPVAAEGEATVEAPADQEDQGEKGEKGEKDEKAKKERKGAREPAKPTLEALSPEAQSIYAEDDLQFAPPKKSPFFFVGAIMAGLFALTVLVDLALWGLKWIDGNACYLVFGFSAPVGVMGLAMMTIKPTAQRTPIYVALGKGLVMLYFMVVSVATVFAGSGYLQPSAAIQIFAYGLSALTMGAWLTIYNPHPADLPWYLCIAKGAIAIALHVWAAAVLLFTADYMQWEDIWNVLAGCGGAVGVGALILVIDVLFTPHPTRG